MTRPIMPSCVKFPSRRDVVFSPSYTCQSKEHRTWIWTCFERMIIKWGGQWFADPVWKKDAIKCGQFWNRNCRALLYFLCLTSATHCHSSKKQTTQARQKNLSVPQEIATLLCLRLNRMFVGNSIGKLTLNVGCNDKKGCYETVVQTYFGFGVSILGQAPGSSNRFKYHFN